MIVDCSAIKTNVTSAKPTSGQFDDRGSALLAGLTTALNNPLWRIVRLHSCLKRQFSPHHRKSTRIRVPIGKACQATQSARCFVVFGVISAT
jgi:hypothetical protein